MSILKPIFDGDGDIRQGGGFVRSPQGGVVVQLHDGKPDWTVPNAQWDGFCEDAIAAINRDGDGDIRQGGGFVRSPQSGVVVQLHDGKPDWTVPNAQWDGFCKDAIAAINRRELERRNREAS